MSAIEIAGLSVESRNRGSGWVHVARTPSGGSVRIPVVVVHGSSPGPVLVVDAATHGDESEGPLAVLQLLHDVNPDELRGTLVGVPVLNGPAFDAATRGNPLEIHSYDLNRSFPGEPNGSITQRVAAAYAESVLSHADAVVSLHGGGSVFYLDGFVIAPATADGLDLVKAMGWKRFTDSPDVALGRHRGTLTEVGVSMGIPAITVEMGGASHRSPRELDRTRESFVVGIRNVMLHYGMLDGEPVKPEVLWRIRKQNLRAANGGIVRVEAGLDIDVEVTSGDRIFQILNPLGEVIEEQSAPFAGRIIGLPGSPTTYPGRIVASVYVVVEEIRM